MSAPPRITKDQLLEEFNRDGINCGYAQDYWDNEDCVVDTFTAVHSTVNRILDERLSRIEKVLSELH